MYTCNKDEATAYTVFKTYSCTQIQTLYLMHTQLYTDHSYSVAIKRLLHHNTQVCTERRKHTKLTIHLHYSIQWHFLP